MGTVTMATLNVTDTAEQIGYKVQNNFVAIMKALNGNIDNANISDTFGIDVLQVKNALPITGGTLRGGPIRGIGRACGPRGCVFLAEWRSIASCLPDILIS